jgi:hypothetical protein
MSQSRRRRSNSSRREPTETPEAVPVGEPPFDADSDDLQDVTVIGHSSGGCHVARSEFQDDPEGADEQERQDR